jgi:pimeloyl-ACP methyl ester carboxylesterase
MPADLSIDAAVQYSLAASCSYLPADRLASGTGEYLRRLAPSLAYSAQLTVDALCASATVFEFADEDAVLVAFRGSVSARNYQSMLQLGLCPSLLSQGDSGRVHRGYQEASLRLYSRLKSFLERRRPARTIFVGHSYGGGTATMCGLLHSADEVCTFAGPRLGDARFAAAYNARLGGATTHLIHDLDPVIAQNQPLWDALGYVHTGRVVRCAADAPLLLPEERRGRGIPWNFGDHARYLGTFMGPRV